ncbi:MAG TPA: SIMPL domain-containing protein [Thermomicrobiales bacterium]|jgi:uncharacterized protein YggE|nr:SIMPL domain-containing protein [Thermomicrobiales bacterium]
MSMDSRRRRGVLHLFGGLALIALLGTMIGGFAAGASAQEATPAASASGTATVSVNGHGSVLVPPDTASVVVGVDVIEKTLGEAQDSATKQMNAIVRALKEAGVKDEDIQTVNFSVNIMRTYDQSGTPGPITGFEVMNQVNVTVRDVNQLGSLLDTVVSKGANSIYGISFYVADPTDAASQARTQAVQDARAKAQELAAAAGLQLGRVISISEGTSPVSPPVPYAASKAQGAGGAPIQAGTSEIDVDVQMTFELIGS